jgi:hypothetical protein
MSGGFSLVQLSLCESTVRYDNPMPELNLSPMQWSTNSTTGLLLAVCEHEEHSCNHTVHVVHGTRGIMSILEWKTKDLKYKYNTTKENWTQPLICSSCVFRHSSQTRQDSSHPKIFFSSSPIFCFCKKSD